MPILMRYENGKCKAVTLSYDDGVYQDIRLSGIFNKNGLKATFFVNGGCFLPEDAVRTSPSGKLKLSEAMEIHLPPRQSAADGVGRKIHRRAYRQSALQAVLRFYRGIAQLVEQRSPKPRVQSSSLCAPAKKKAKSKFDLAFFSEIRLRRVKFGFAK